MATIWNFGIYNASEAFQRHYFEDQKKTVRRNSEIRKLENSGDFAGERVKRIKYELKDLVERLKRLEAAAEAKANTSANDFSFVIDDDDYAYNYKQQIKNTREQIELYTKQLADAIEIHKNSLKERSTL